MAVLAINWNPFIVSFVSMIYIVFYKNFVYTYDFIERSGDKYSQQKRVYDKIYEYECGESCRSLVSG